MKVLADLFACLKSAHDRHLYVEYDRIVVVWHLFSHLVESNFTVLRGVNYVKVLLEGLPESK